MHEIKIYGEIVPFQDSWIIENGYCNLTHVQSQLKEANGEDVKVRLNSFGGDVEEGFAIYSELRRYAKENNAKITTLAEGRCASIATVIFLAGDTRILNEYVQPFVHNAWTYAIGDAKQVMRIAEDLEKASKMIAEHYASHTNLTYEEARNLMDAETSITSNEALEIRFATEIEEILRPAALQKIFANKSKVTKSKINSKNSDMNKSKNQEKGFFNHVKKFFQEEGSGTKNSIEVHTSTNDTLIFPDLEEGDTPKVGDKAEINGEAANGDYLLQDGKTTYVFVSGALDEIKKEEEEGDDEMENLKKENAELKKQLESQNSRIDKIENKQKENEKFYNMLKEASSKYNVDEKENEGKSRDPEPSKGGGLAKAAQRLNKDQDGD